MKRLLILVLGLSGAHAWAFPEMVRHGYTQCTACHVSPSGGGILTSYGRQLSAELMSTWKFAREEQVLHGALPKDPSEKGVLIGGDVRAIQIHSKTPTERSGRFFLMQANADVAYVSGAFTGMISVGQIEKPMVGYVQGNFNSTKYYGQVAFTDSWTARAGRFVPSFGLNLPDHVLVTKNGTGFSPGLQMDSVETSLLTENWSVFLAQGRTIPQTAASRSEMARTASVAYSFLERFKVGVSHWYGERESGEVRRLWGANAILGFTHKFYNLTEIDWSHNGVRDGRFAMTRFGWEVYRGVIPYLQYQDEQSDLEDRSKRVAYYTAGIHLFPRPHFEISGQWSRVKTDKEWRDSGYLLTHYYF